MGSRPGLSRLPAPSFRFSWTAAGPKAAPGWAGRCRVLAPSDAFVLSSFLMRPSFPARPHPGSAAVGPWQSWAPHARCGGVRAPSQAPSRHPVKKLNTSACREASDERN